MSRELIDLLEKEEHPLRDRIWETLKVVSDDIATAFAIDCSFRAYACAAYTADDAADAAVHGSVYAYASTAYADENIKEQENQVDALIMLIKRWDK